MTLPELSHILVSIEYWSYATVIGLSVILGSLLIALTIFFAFVWCADKLFYAIVDRLNLLATFLHFIKWKREQNMGNGEQA